MTGLPLYTLELPGFLTPSLNERIGKHWSRVRRANKGLSWQVRLAHKGPLPDSPIIRARVEVERRNTRSLDRDNFIGGLKGLVDCLRQASKDMPHGLGFILDDDDAHLELVGHQVAVRKVAERGTTVRIWALPPG